MTQINSVSQDIINAYWDDVARSTSPATLKRKNASLNKFFDWAQTQGHIEENPMPSSQVVIPSGLPVVTSKPKNNTTRLWTILMLGTSLALAGLIFLTVWKLKLPIPFIANRAADVTNDINPVSVIPFATPGTNATPTSLPTPLPTIPANSAVNPVANPESPVPLPQNSFVSAISSLLLSGSNPTIDASDGNLLIQGKTVTVKTTDGGNGNITLNPDGFGTLQLLFEGTGKNFLDAEAPNLNIGTLIYGKVANNSTGYNLLRLQNGSASQTRFNVDASGNTYASGNIDTPGNIQINGVTRLSSLGRLGSITGYYQDSGLFEIKQGTSDYATINKTLTTSTGPATSDGTTLTLDESALTTGSNYDTLVLNRKGGVSDAYALYVQSGNALFNGTVGIGTTIPTSKLQVADSSTTTGDVVYATASAITSGSILKLGQGGNTPFNGNVLLADIDRTGGGGGTFTGNFLLLKNNDTAKYTIDASGNTTSAGYYGAAANTDLRLRASGTGVGQTGTGSIYFQDSSGNTKGRFDTTQTGLNVGNGKDGAVSYSTATTINNNSQTYFGDQAITTTSTSGQAVVSATTTTNLAAGDEVLLIQMQGNGAGSYEFHKITSVSAGVSITLDDNLTNTYTKDSTSSAQIVEVPHFTNVTFSATGSISPAAWNGTIGGVLIFRANGVVDCTSAAAICIFADGKGYRGGASSEAGSGTQGEGIGLTQSNSASKRWNGGGGGTRGAAGGGGSGGSEWSSGTNAAGGSGGKGILPYDLSRWFMGGGGGGGGDDSDIAGVDGGAGGAGGGIVYIESQKIVIPSTGKNITSTGSNGTAAPSNDGGGGGAGAGGFVWLRGDTIDLLDQTTSRYIIAQGGAGGALSGSGAVGAAGGDGITRIDARSITGSANESSTTNGLLITYYTTNVSNLGVLHVGKVDTEAADVAEVYQSEDNLEPGDIVQTALSVTDPNIDKKLAVQKANTPYSGIFGAVSTKPGLVLGYVDIPSKYRTFPIALNGRTPVKVTNLGGSIHKGDAIALSSIPGVGQRAVRLGNIVGFALEDFDPETSPVAPCPIAGAGDDPQVVCGSVTTFIQPGWYNPQTQIAAIDSITQSVASASAGFLNSASSFTEMIAANIADGATITKNAAVTNLLTVKNLIAESFNAVQGTVDSLLVKTGLVSGNIATKLITPLADETDVAIRLGSEASPFGKLAIQNHEGTDVATIDSIGNATFSGTVKSVSTVTDTLVAGSIKSKSLDDITNLLTQVESDQNLIKESYTWNTATATNSADFATLSAGELYITGRAAISSLYIAKGLAMGSDLHISSVGSGTNLYINSIDTLNSPLRLQSLAAAPLEIMGGLIAIDTSGNMQIAGNLRVAGVIESSGLTIKSKDTDVATVDASGSAAFTSLATQNLIIAGPKDSTDSASVDGVITTNSTVGSVTIPAGVVEITIKNPKVTDYSFVYVTPTSDTENNVLYVKSKQNGQFVVGFNNPINTETNFNWWIVQVR